MLRAALGLQGVMDGLSYMRRHSDVARIALIKGGWAIVGGALLLLTVFGDRIFRIGDSSDAGIGILFAARGIGAMTGSLVVSLIAARQGNLIRLIAPAYFIAGACYAALAIVPTIWFAAASGRGSAHFRIDSLGVEQRPFTDEGAGRIPRPCLCRGTHRDGAGPVRRGVHEQCGNLLMLSGLAAAGNRRHVVVAQLV